MLYSRARGARTLTMGLARVMGMSERRLRAKDSEL